MLIAKRKNSSLRSQGYTWRIGRELSGNCLSGSPQKLLKNLKLNVFEDLLPENQSVHKISGDLLEKNDTIM